MIDILNGYHRCFCLLTGCRFSIHNIQEKKYPNWQYSHDTGPAGIACRGVLPVECGVFPLDYAGRRNSTDPKRWHNNGRLSPHVKRIHIWCRVGARNIPVPFCGYALHALGSAHWRHDLCCRFRVPDDGSCHLLVASLRLISGYAFCHCVRRQEKKHKVWKF